MSTPSSDILSSSPKTFCVVTVLYTLGLGIYFWLVSLENLRMWRDVTDYSLLVTVFICVLTIWASLRSTSGKSTNAYWVSTFVLLVPCILLTFSIIYADSELVSNNTTIQPDKPQSLYFSFVTFTTLGYGDFSPNEKLRPIAAFQAFLGFTFVPLFVAELLKFSQRSQPSQSENNIKGSLKTLLKISIAQQEKVEIIAYKMSGLADTLVPHSDESASKSEDVPHKPDGTTS